jgi:hypothetical protein
MVVHTREMPAVDGAGRSAQAEHVLEFLATRVAEHDDELFQDRAVRASGGLVRQHRHGLRCVVTDRVCASKPGGADCRQERATTQMATWLVIPCLPLASAPAARLFAG